MSNDEMKQGIFCWNELMTRDPEKATKFYTELIGWQTVDSDIQGMKYTTLKAGDKDAAGLMEMPSGIPEEVPSHWMAYIAVDDVDPMAKKTIELGGQVLHGPEDIPNIGRFCVIQDPSGGVVSLYTPKSKMK
jgi:hypothetical protein